MPIIDLGRVVGKDGVVPQNLLDNSDFTNPVNQAGLGGFHGAALYALDRWLYNGTSGQLSLNDGVGLSYPNGFVAYQRLGRGNVLDGNSYTLALWTSDGVAHCVQLTSGYVRIGTCGYAVCHNNENAVYINNNNATLPIAYVALYKGTYTTETLPPYVPKGYAAELAECRWYYRKQDTQPLVGVAFYANSVAVIGLEKSPMRKVPTVTVDAIKTVDQSVSYTASNYISHQDGLVWIGTNEAIQPGQFVYVWGIEENAEL